MKFLGAMLIVVGIVQAVLLVLGVGIGFVLHWIIPDLDIGTAILVGEISAVAGAHLIIKFMQLAPWLHPFSADMGSSSGDEEEEDDEDDDEFEDLEVRVPRSRSRTRRGRRRRR